MIQSILMNVRKVSLFIGLIAFINSVLAQDGTLDVTFNPGTGVSSGTGIRAIALQPDGKIIIGGSFTSYNGITRNFLVRINADGSLDNTFNIGTGANLTIYTVVIQPDGRILIGGDFTSYNGTTVRGITRLNTDGSIDNTFNVGGTGVNGGSPNGISTNGGRVFTIVLQPDGKILVGGNFGGYNGLATQSRALIRLNTDGSIDNTFNWYKSTGTIATYLPTNITAIAVQADGRILVGGAFEWWYLGNVQSRVSWLWRTSSTGTVESTFGIPVNNNVNALVLQPDGKILMSCYNASGYHFLSRYNSDGSFDATVSTIIGDVRALALQPDGKIIIGGNFTLNNGNGTTLNRVARLNADFSLDNTFNVGTGANNILYALVLQPDGKVLIGGNFTTYNGTIRNRIARLNGYTPCTPITTNISGSFCTGGFYYYNGIAVSEAGQWSIPYTSSRGCDSTVILTVTEKQPSSSSQTSSICAGESYNFNGQQLTRGGQYQSTLTNAAGCDSTITLTLTVHPLPQPTVSQNGSVLSTQSFNSYKWLRNGSIIDTNVQTITPTQSGLYSVVVTDANGCQDTSSVLQFTITGVKNFSQSVQLNIYPNPFTEDFVIESNISESLTYTLHDVSGKALAKQTFIKKTMVDMSAYATGSYIISITNQLGESDTYVVVKK